jgi:hypothetical protein
MLIMKRLIPILMLLLALIVSQACEGPEGPAGAPGPQGPQGPAGAAGTAGAAGAPGSSVSSTIYEISGWNFAADTTQLGFSFADFNIPVNDSDAVLVYRLRGVVNNTTPVWSMLPQLIFFPDKTTLQYDFIHSSQALAIFINGSVNLDSLGTQWTKNQVFRLVVIPGQFGLRTDGTRRKINLADYNVDYKNYEAVLKYFRLSDKNVRRISLPR